ncbi:MAG: bifunctional diaminohydroxyphosphoribosylaminopyrimidine deaminase/5-amino-6-(5-phosphoribosylamino)uracil reductase RibD [Bacteroidota bacterium]
MTEERQKYFMRQAILEGRKALPKCRPNPPVGCVIVQYGKIIARGHTNRPGQDHAEAMALRQVDEEAADLEIFVTLEPCSYHGRTPSCARAIAHRNVKKVYVGLIDPHPRNQGAGIVILESADIPVEIGLLREEILAELRPYLIHHHTEE